MVREICGYTVLAVAHSHFVEFTVYDDEINVDPNVDPEFDGSIKWDGCSNWDFGKVCMHFCSIDRAQNLGTLLGKLYEWAGELMPDHKDHILDRRDG